ncbi:MAG: hypothetical protein MJK10_14320 [Pseudomonadales bacterium]|nr:hypothetical protein [Pseudomonadales bacterium]NRA17057.1 hypothetical protein [Oceanospirillaceae bacterium]
MRDHDQENADRDSHEKFQSLLNDILASLQQQPDTQQTEQRLEQIISAAPAAELSSLSQLAPACLTALSFFLQHKLPLDAQMIRILTESVTSIATQSAAILAGTDVHDDSHLRTALLTRLTVYVMETTGLELDYYEDVYVEGAGINQELENVEAILSSQSQAPQVVVDKKTNPEPQLVAKQSTKVSRNL